MTLPRRLYHYTCSHWVEAIAADRGTIRPPSELVAQMASRIAADEEGLNWEVPRLVWLSDIDPHEWSDVKALGLAGDKHPCNRIEFRYIVPRLGNIEAWSAWVERTDHPNAHLLEHAPGAQPDHWWVSEVAITGCRLDTRYRSTIVGRPARN